MKETWCSKNLKGKGDMTQRKKSCSNPQKHKVDDRAYESSKKGEKSPIKKKKKIKKVWIVKTLKMGSLGQECLVQEIQD